MPPIIAKVCLITTVDRNGVTEGDGLKKKTTHLYDFLPPPLLVVSPEFQQPEQLLLVPSLQELKG